MGEVEARLFAEEGATVVIADVLDKEGSAVAADISASQRQARFVRTDVTSESDWQKLITEVVAAYGRLDILVNNAGISGSAVGDTDGLEGWQRLLAVNATSVFLGTKLAAAEMATTGGGSVVNISSIMGIVASEDSHPGEGFADAATEAGETDRGCIWRAVSGVGRGIVRHRRGTGDRWRLYCAMIQCPLQRASQWSSHRHVR